MTLRIGDVVARGEIFNTQRNSVHGWLALRDSDRRVALLHGRLKAKEKDAKGLYSERAAERIKMAEAFIQQ